MTDKFTSAPQLTREQGTAAVKLLESSVGSVIRGKLPQVRLAISCLLAEGHLLIEDKPAEDDTILPQGGFNVFVDPFSMQYLNGVIIDYVTSMQGSGFTFKNPNATGGCGCGSSFSA